MAVFRKALLEFFLADNVLFTFIIRPEIPELSIKDEEPIVLEASVNQQEINEIVQRIKHDFTKPSTASGVKADDYPMNDFYLLGELLFSDKLMSYIQDFDALYLVPFGPLHYLPLHAMKYKGQFLIDLFQIAYLPSASVLQYVQPAVNQLDEEVTILLCGVDSTGDKNLFVYETDQIAELSYWNEKVYLNREQSTKAGFFAHCEKKKIIHISSHGHFAQHDPLASGAAMFGEYSNQYLDGDGLSATDYDYLLTAKDIFENASLDTDLFVMSGCVTGESEYKTGDELIGLTRALMYAGARSMIVTLFPTFKNATSQSQNTDLQFARFYDYWIGQKMSKVEAMQKFIQGIKKNPDFAHPYNWMSYVLVGNMT